MLNAAHPASRLPPPAPNSLFAPARALLYTPHLPRRHRRRRRRVNPPLHLRGPRTSRFSTYFIRHHGRSTSPRPPTATHDAPPSNTYVTAVVFSYGFSSLSGVFVNKACLSAFQFTHTITLMLLQLVVSVSALTLLRLMRVISIPQRTPRQLAVLLLPAVFFISNVTVGLLALKLVNIPMFSAFRRLTVLSVMLLEYLVLRKSASTPIIVTVFVMVAGSFLAALGDLAFDPLGYCLVFLNNLITAANLVSIKKATQIVHLDALALFYYVSLISLPIVCVLCVFSGELALALSDLYSRQDLHSLSFVFALTLSAASAFLINFFTNMCTQLTSPLTTAITGQMKNVLQTILGIFAFGYVVTPLNLFGLAVALFGSLLFASQKYAEAQNTKNSKAVLPPTSNVAPSLPHRTQTANEPLYERKLQDFESNALLLRGNDRIASSSSD
ncbi:UDP-N-acetylglucosamine/UDP-glucose/GDP-mannose transporter [Gracilariopsis chorda]|uniref:UDP-N-acetylglucosamine/UDP-glucose/GDP-mannose transporter n=1 Tax=Gracilariopsis chorda TaxID=448386 RepID=A0A2V3IWN3_9FLOR|nr:UDP-N-acetylglucosamine/UDP-glucose/GDP-mannose transporter [Gracilariopsis chorda]|eukprot:PXF46509.1 UDP-N-acetylglucosamine/UDP-glucose/GDP-mannose transporter [Gracilariopsis chorda]